MDNSYSLLLEIVKKIDTANSSELEQVKQYFDDQIKAIYDAQRHVTDGAYFTRVIGILESINATQRELLEKVQNYGVKEFHIEFTHMKSDIDRLVKIIEFEGKLNGIPEITEKQVSDKFKESGYQLKQVADQFHVAIPTAHGWLKGKRKLPINLKMNLLNFFEDKIKSDGKIEFKKVEK